MVLHIFISLVDKTMKSFREYVNFIPLYVRAVPESKQRDNSKESSNFVRKILRMSLYLQPNMSLRSIGS